jgi:flagellar biosynthesis protein FlhB
MLTYKGGNKVGKGTYWDLAKGRRIDVASEGVLTGEGTTYFRMSSAVMLLAGPVIGLLYAILMPIIGIATVVTLAVRAVLQGMYNLAAKSISFGWQPMNAYLAGKKKKREAGKK